MIGELSSLGEVIITSTIGYVVLIALWIVGSITVVVGFGLLGKSFDVSPVVAGVIVSLLMFAVLLKPTLSLLAIQDGSVSAVPEDAVSSEDIVSIGELSAEETVAFENLREGDTSRWGELEEYTYVEGSDGILYEINKGWKGGVVFSGVIGALANGGVFGYLAYMWMVSNEVENVREYVRSVM